MADRDDERDDERADDERDERDEADDETSDDESGDESDESGEGERETWHQPPAHAAHSPEPLTLQSIRETIAAQSQLIQTLIQQQREMADRHERHLKAFRDTLEVQRAVAQTMNEEIKALGEARTELGKVTAAMVKIARVQQETLAELQAEADEESE